VADGGAVGDDTGGIVDTLGIGDIRKIRREDDGDDEVCEEVPVGLGGLVGVGAVLGGGAFAPGGEAAGLELYEDELAVGLDPAGGLEGGDVGHAQVVEGDGI
jgi:hypothetical protein